MTSRSFALVSVAVLLAGLGTGCDPSDDGGDAGGGGGAGGDPDGGNGFPGEDGSVPDASAEPDAGDAAVADHCPEPAGAGTTHQGVIDADETWTLEDSPHVITGDLSIQASTVTIEGCVVVRVQEGRNITIGGTGSEPDSALVAKGEVPSVANGEQHRPVRFVADEDGTHWGSIHVLESGRVDLEVVVLEDGGAHATAQNYGGTLVAVGGGGPDLARIVRTVNVRVLRSEGFGVNLQSFAAFTEDSRDLLIAGAGQTPSPSNIVTDHPLFVAPPALQTIPVGEYTGNAVDAIDVFNQSQVHIDETFRAHGVPYLLRNGFAMIPEAASGPITLTLEAGVRLLFPRGDSGVVSMNLGQSGEMLDSDQGTVRLVAQGTTDGPIVLTSAEQAPRAGDWGGVFWAAGPATGNVIDHMRIEYAGGDSGFGSFGCGPPDNDAALIITNWRPSEDFIDNLAISDSAGGGIVSGWASDDYGPDLSAGNTFTDIANGCDVARWQDESSPACPGDGSTPSCL